MVAIAAALIFTKLFKISIVIISFFGSFFNFSSDFEPLFFWSCSVFALISLSDTNAVSLPDEIADKIISIIRESM